MQFSISSLRIIRATAGSYNLLDWGTHLSRTPCVHSMSNRWGSRSRIYTAHHWTLSASWDISEEDRKPKRRSKQTGLFRFGNEYSLSLIRRYAPNPESDTPEARFGFLYAMGFPCGHSKTSSSILATLSCQSIIHSSTFGFSITMMAGCYYYGGARSQL